MINCEIPPLFVWVCVLVTDIQTVAWTAFAILAIFSCANISVVTLTWTLSYHVHATNQPSNISSSHFSSCRPICL